MDLIRSLSHDPDKWVHHTVVAFVPHEIKHAARTRADGTLAPAETIKVTEAQLRLDADRANERVRKSGQLDTLTIGHRSFDPGFKEIDQPPLVGFCRNYRVQWIEREDGRFLGMVYDEYAAKDKALQYDLYRQFPFRSSEYHPSVGIHGVAALVRPPALNMGTNYIYQANTEDPTMTPTEFRTLFAECMKTYQADLAAEEAKKKVPDPAPVPVPAPTPAPTPAPVPDPQLATYAADLASLRQQLAGETAARVQAECKSLLDPLVPLVKFDYARELGVLSAATTPAARLEHVSYMAKNYMPLPTAAGMIQVYGGPAPVGGDPTDPTRDQPKRAEIRSYMMAHPGMQYEQAEAHVLGQK